jgi:hypothetical protein
MWSGEFWEQDDTFGYMSVAHDDQRQHYPPKGWTLVKSLEEPDAEVFIYRRVCDSCPVCIDCGGQGACLSSHST